MAATLQQLSRDDLCTLWRDRMPQDFPKEEIKPLSLLLSLYDRGQNRTFVLTDGGEALAYAILEMPDRGDVWLLDYLAVSSAARGRGLGSTVLSAGAAAAVLRMRRGLRPGGRHGGDRAHRLRPRRRRL